MEPSLADRAAARHELILRRARGEFLAFAEYVFAFKPAPHHHQWAEAVVTRPRVAVVCPPEMGKTSLLAIALPLWRLGRDPNVRIAIISETATQGARPLAAIRQAIAQNRRLQEVFPHLRPAGGAREKWSDSEILIERSEALKEPSIIALGIGGPLLGVRLELAILDDCVSFESAWTAAQRAKTLAWFRSTLIGRVVAEGQVVALGNPWHRDDLLGHLQQSSDYHVVRTPAEDSDGTPTWPEVWPRDRLDQRRRELGLVEYRRQMLLEPPADEGSRFSAEWFEAAFKAGTAGGLSLVDSYAGPHATFSGVDLGVGQEARHDQSVIFTVAKLPGGRRQVLNIERGRWQAPELIDRLAATQRRYRCRLRVETNGAQDFVRQMLRAKGVAVDAHVTTAAAKSDPRFGIESLAAEVEQGRWSIPDAPATRAWVQECLTYSPSEHTPDGLMAAWLAREAAREAEAFVPLLPLTSGGTAPLDRYRREGVIVARPGMFPDEEDGVGCWERSAPLPWRGP